ncbi:MAG: tRNA (cytidine(56)-2'-O)-methyltransferase [Candidatus Bathyarchaeota archaeon]|nr:MAG: tRNA (cytidine(56)-2'-O)-methyltransferase [Candidatus Bathyarchaeota archaeon]
MTKILVLRLGHRPARDKRLTTHVALTARGLGADGIIIHGVEDPKIVHSVNRVVENWGGPFSISFCSSWKSFITEWLERGGEVIHLTMYGVPLPEGLEQIRKSDKDKLVVVGAEKVPREVYDLATHNVSVTHQPISEVSALAVFLDRYFNGYEFCKEFEGRDIRIIRHSNRKKKDS